MTNVVPFQSNSMSVPSSSTREIDLLTARFTNALEEHPSDFRRRTIPASRAPSDEQRARLEKRRAKLRRSLTPTPGEAVADVIAAIIAGSAQFGLSEEEAQLKTSLYAEALDDQPTWAIDKARRIFGKGGWRCLWDGKGCPSSAHVAAECRHILLPIEAELARLDAVLDAEPTDIGISDHDRAGAVARWETVKAGIRRGAAITQPTEDEISAERAEQARANARFRERQQAEAAQRGRHQAMWGRLAISDELARQLGLSDARGAPKRSSATQALGEEASDGLRA